MKRALFLLLGLTVTGSAVAQRFIAINLPETPAAEQVSPQTKRAFNGALAWEYNVLPEGAMIVTVAPRDRKAQLSGDIVVPETLNGLTVIGIGEGVFRDQADIRSITLPEGLRSIGGEAFVNCAGLTSMTLPKGVTSIGRRAFAGCRNLEWVDLQGPLTTLPGGLFSGDRKLKRILLPEGVKKVETGAFCVTTLDQVIFPESLCELEPYALAGLMHTTVAFLGAPPKVLGEQQNGQPVPLFLARSAEDRPGVPLKTYYHVPDTYQEAWKAVADDKGRWYGQTLKLIRDAKQRGAEEYALGPKPKVSEAPRVFTPAAAEKYPGLKKAFPKESPVAVEWQTREVNGELHITGLKPLHPGETVQGVLVIPGTLKEKPVTTLGRNALRGQKDLTEIYLEEGIKTIGRGAFSNCRKLKKVVMADSIDYMEGNTFEFCGALEEVVFSKNLSKVPTYCFRDCRDLCELSLPNRLISIDANAFDGCLSLRSLTVPASVVTLFGNCFANASLTTVRFLGKPPATPSSGPAMSSPFFDYGSYRRFGHFIIEPKYWPLWEAQLKDGKWHGIRLEKYKPAIDGVL